jgi:hypothetical protein
MVPIDLMQVVLGVAFLGIWTMAGVIVVRDR